MKKIISALILGSLLTANAYSKGSVGFKVGLSSAKFKDDYYKEYNKRLTGADVGLVFETSIYKDYVSFRPEITFIQKGASEVFYINNIQVIEKFRLNYLEIPLLFQGGYSRNKFSVYVQLGPYISVGTNGKVIDIVKSTKEREEERIDLGLTSRGADIDIIDAGLQTGVGGSYKLGKGKLEANLRFGIGLNKIDRLNVIQNRTIQFTVGYLLPIGKGK